MPLNLNLDNAWFRHDLEGGLHVGLLDWGATARMNVAQSFYGMVCAAETGFLREHRDELLRLFADVYHENGGPALDLARLRRHYALSVALLGVAWIMDAPSLIAQQLPGYADLSGRNDPALETNFLARAQRQLLMVFLSDWRDLDIGAVLRTAPSP